MINFCSHNLVTMSSSSLLEDHLRLGIDNRCRSDAFPMTRLKAQERLRGLVEGSRLPSQRRFVAPPRGGGCCELSQGVVAHWP